MNENIMRAAGFGPEVQLVKNKQCPFCKKFVNEQEFTKDIERKEFKISGLCKSCQDDFFK